MAFGLKRWIGAAVLSLLIIGVWGLPPEGRFFSRVSSRTPEAAALRTVNGEVTRTNGLLKRLRWLDSLDTAFGETGQVTPGVAVGLPAGAPAAPYLKYAVRRGAEELGLKGPGRARLGVFVVDRDQGAHPRVRSHTLWNSREYYALEGRGAPACLVVMSERTTRDMLFRARSDSVADPDLLGPCAFYYRYGAPGDGVRRWLGHGGFAFAERPSTSRPGDRITPGSSRAGGFSQLFGIDPGRFSGVSMGARACLGGAPDECVRVLREGEEPFFRSSMVRWLQDEGLPLLGENSRRLGGPFGGFEGALLADVEAEFGSERFREFWASDAPLEEAFQASFGQPLGVWVMAWGRRRLGTDQRGPRLGVGTLILSLLATGLALGGGVLVVEGRSLG